MKNIRILKADTSHANLLSKLGAETFAEAFAHHNNPDDFNSYLQKSFNKEQIEKELNETGSTFFLAYYGDELAGYSRLRESKEVQEKFPGKQLLELQRIYCLQKFIGKGIGKALLTSAIKFAEKNRFDVLWLGVWEHNHHATHFYKHFGFESFDSHVFMLGNDAQIDILMHLKINE